MLRWALIALLGYLLWRMIKRGPPDAQLTESTKARTPYEVLGVSSDASPEEIKAAFQKAIRENHPDKVAEMSEEIRALAERKTREVTSAYEQLRAD